LEALKEVRSSLAREGVRAVPAGRGGISSRLASCDIAVALGGDGTMLRAARVLANGRLKRSIPLLGINAGGLGFLSAVDLAGFKRDLRRILAGRFKVEPRWMLSVEAVRGGRRIFGPHTALNDCVIRCSGTTRAVTLRVQSAGHYVADFFGDGIIVSTATGSTAYALAAGGPVMVPGLDAFLLVPICPHAVTQRPLVTSSSNPFSVTLVRKNPHDRPDAHVALDGQIESPLRPGDAVLVRRHEKPFMLLLPPARSHFDLLRNKLKWGAR